MYCRKIRTQILRTLTTSKTTKDTDIKDTDH